VETAGRFADVFALRGYDSVQLAAAHELHVTSTPNRQLSSPATTAV